MIGCIIVMTLFFTPIGKSPESGSEQEIIQGTNTITVEFGDVDSCYIHGNEIVKSYQKRVRARIVAHIEILM